MTQQRPIDQVPDGLQTTDELRGALRNQRVVVLVDFDGTLSSIVDDPDDAEPVDGARRTLERLLEHCPVGVISGRDLDDVRERVGVDGAWYAGSHGFDIVGPNGERHEHEDAVEILPSLDAAESALNGRLEGVAGVRVERKRFSLSVHVRSAAPEDVSQVTDVVDEVGAEHRDLRVTEGRELRELGPDLEWDKGAALAWLLEQIEPSGAAFPIFAGDDVTDEDALEVVRDTGLGIVVRSEERGAAQTFAQVSVGGPHELCELLGRFVESFDSGELSPT